MLYETLNQPSVFLYLFLIGLLCGLIFDAINLLNYFFSHNNIVKQIFLFLGICSVFFIFSRINLIVNYGDFRLFPFLAFFGAIFIERITIGFLFAKIVDKCYNKIRLFWKKVGKLFNGRKKKKSS